MNEGDVVQTTKEVDLYVNPGDYSFDIFVLPIGSKVKILSIKQVNWNSVYRVQLEGRPQPFWLRLEEIEPITDQDVK